MNTETITEWRDLLDLGFHRSRGVFRIDGQWFLVSSRVKIPVKPGLVDALMGHRVLQLGSRPLANRKHLHGLRAACTEVRPTRRGRALRHRLIQDRVERASLLSIKTSSLLTNEPPL